METLSRVYNFIYSVPVVAGAISFVLLKTAANGARPNNVYVFPFITHHVAFFRVVCFPLAFIVFWAGFLGWSVLFEENARKAFVVDGWLLEYVLKNNSEKFWFTNSLTILEHGLRLKLSLFFIFNSLEDYYLLNK